MQLVLDVGVLVVSSLSFLSERGSLSSLLSRLEEKNNKWKLILTESFLLDGIANSKKNFSNQRIREFSSWNIIVVCLLKRMRRKESASEA